MTQASRKSSIRRAALGLALALIAGSACADKPSWAGGGGHKEGKERHEERDHDDRDRDRDRDDGRRGASVAFSFGGDERRIVGDYYGAQARQGHCPPGLAKKHNGCQPPGQAKKWQRGQPLARGVEYYELPNELRLRLPAPPPNHRYVQVAGDILMIAVGSSIVVDAMEDLLR